MIHNVELPLETLARLSEVVQLQLDLLRFATEPEAQIDIESLSHYLERHSRYNGRGTTIAGYIVGTPGRPGRFGRLLQGVIDSQQGAEVWNKAIRAEQLRLEKRQVIDWMNLDILKLALGRFEETFGFYLLNNTAPAAFTAVNHHIAHSPENEKIKYPDWLQAMRRFLQEFYDALEGGLSARLFQDGKGYGRQDYFRAFVQENKGQFVCAICDETSFRTITQKPDQPAHFHSDIEHYFPQSIYPHLSCHPYNLIPICKFCNQALHGDKDPLNNTDHPRRNLGDVFLPYGQGSLAESGSLKIVWDGEQPALQLVGRMDSAELGRKLWALHDIYDIPGRWQQKQDEIGDHLWRRIRHFLADDVEVSDVFDSADQIQRKLSRLLAYIHEDLGRDPLSFPSLWWLASLIELETSTDNNQPFLLEIQNWIKYDQVRKTELDTLAQELRNIVVTIHQR
ncbi:MAG TPA: hypothetical protein PLD25_28330 [Chloroflexota bacterium]|nr:hypothetical protein [Chloroflexota bacterium]HUM67787.1 hypothetical protein [Chloroflexota bacterium]